MNVSFGLTVTNGPSLMTEDRGDLKRKKWLHSISSSNKFKQVWGNCDLLIPHWLGGTISLTLRFFMSMLLPSSHLNAAIGPPHVTI